MTSQRWQAEILAGVEIIPYIGATPGTLTLLNHSVCSILPGNDIWMAASEFGYGRILVVGHEGYFKDFNVSNNKKDKHLAQLHRNTQLWLTKDKFTSASDIGILGHIAKADASRYRILLWCGADNVRDISSQDLLSFVHNGGAVIHCMCSWGWLQLRPGKTLNEMPFSSFLNTVGINYNNAAIYVPETGINVRHLAPQNVACDKVAISANTICNTVDSTGQCWRQDLLKGVNTIPNTGAVPGSIVIFGESTRPILSGSKNVEVWVCASELGTGRVLTVAHEGYLSDFIKGHQDMNLRTFHDNIKHWLTNGIFRNNTDIVFANSPKKQLIPGNGSILIWSGQQNISFTSEEVLNFVMSGGAFIHTMCPWGWLCLNPGRTLDDMPFTDILNVIGVSYTGRQVVIPAQGLDVYKCSSDDSCHLGRAVDAITTDSANLANLGDAVNLISELSTSKLKIFSEKLSHLANIVDTTTIDFVPSECFPVSSNEGKALMGLCEALCKAGKLSSKIPGIHHFPGEFSAVPDKVSVQLKVNSHIEDVHPTGYYVQAGESISINVLSPSALTHGWCVQIGAHSDCLTGQNILKRWPKVVCSQNINQMSIDLHSAFGGLVYLRSPDGKRNIEIQLDNVVEAPFFDVTVPSTVANWRTRRNAPGLWADISGEFLTITLPSSSVRKLENPLAVMQTWDRVLQAHFHLRGSDIRNHRRQWLVTDVQPSVGYMHSGYPVVTHLDVADPCHEFHLLSNESLCSKGSWGVFHEFGHNMQRDVWTFPGTVEVTVNIFTLHAMDTVCRQRPWIHSWLQNQIPSTKTYLNSNADYSKWQSDPGIALFIYAQIAHHFGWPVYKAVFRKYESMNSNSKPSQEQDQIDLWYTMLSDICGHNLAPLVDFWKIPLSMKARTTMNMHAPFLPDDEIIRLSPERTGIILQKYPNSTRKPAYVLEDKFHIHIDPPVVRQSRMDVSLM